MSIYVTQEILFWDQCIVKVVVDQHGVGHKVSISTQSLGMLSEILTIKLIVIRRSLHLVAQPLSNVSVLILDCSCHWFSERRIKTRGLKIVRILLRDRTSSCISTPFLLVPFRLKRVPKPERLVLMTGIVVNGRSYIKVRNALWFSTLPRDFGRHSLWPWLVLIMHLHQNCLASFRIASMYEIWLLIINSLNEIKRGLPLSIVCYLTAKAGHPLIRTRLLVKSCPFFFCDDGESRHFSLTSVVTRRECRWHWEVCIKLRVLRATLFHLFVVHWERMILISISHQLIRSFVDPVWHPLRVPFIEVKRGGAVDMRTDTSSIPSNSDHHDPSVWMVMVVIGIVEEHLVRMAAGRTSMICVAPWGWCVAIPFEFFISQDRMM